MINIQEVKNRAEIFNKLVKELPENISKKLLELSYIEKSEIQEIRIRVNQPLFIVSPSKSYPLNKVVSPKDINEIFKSICQCSVYSFQEQLKEGFITFKGGHRIGIGSSAVIENNQISNIKNITSFNIRIAREFKGSAKNIYEKIKNNKLGTLIVGMPASGKTTILRDLAYLASKEGHKKVTIVDQRFEIACAWNAVPQMDIYSCDILAGFPKALGILRAIRCLSPEIIICDEIGSLDDAYAITQCLNSGVNIIASIHAKNIDELTKKPQAAMLIQTGGFEKIVILKDSHSPGEISKIIEVGDLTFHETNWNRISSDFRDFHRMYDFA